MVEGMIDTRLPPWPSRPALFLDLDGTLLEIAAEPHLAEPSARLHALLPILRPATGGAVALISGRTIVELDRLLAPHRFAAAGIHGLERRDGSGRLSSAAVDGALLAPVRFALSAFAASHAGLALEDKRLTLALHYRLRPDLEPRVSEFVHALELPSSLEVLRGRMVFEIKPAGTNKGAAISHFMNESPFRGRTPVFIGDDVTDEAGFAVVNALDGVSIKVEAGETTARWRLRGVDAVLEWLERSLEFSTAGIGMEAANE
jgi:trehalose 6-phosphate phosphatase